MGVFYASRFLGVFFEFYTLGGRRKDATNGVATGLENNTFLFAGASETDAIKNDPNLAAVFVDQGLAFESL